MFCIILCPTWETKYIISYHIISRHHSCFVWFHVLQGQQSTSYHNIISYCIILYHSTHCIILYCCPTVKYMASYYICTAPQRTMSRRSRVISYVSKLLSWYKPLSGFISFHRRCLALFKNRFPASLLPQFLVVNAGELFRVGSCTSNRKTD